MEKQVYEFIAVQTGEKIEEWRECSNCRQDFAITDKDLEFYDKISPMFNGTKYEIPAPTLCPDCRAQKKYALLNLTTLYKRKCDFTNKTIVSIYSPDSDYKVYDQEIWRSDKRDPIDYGRDFDFTRPFFEQFDNLNSSVPKLSLINMSSENSEYTALWWWNKDCYMIVWNHSENCYYWIYTVKSVNTVDYFFSAENENCYEVVYCNKCYLTFFSNNSESCSNSYFLYNCKSCNNCFWCVNLVNKDYHIFNKQVSKDEFNNFVKENINWSYSNIEKLKKQFDEFKKDFPLKNLLMTNVFKSFWNNVKNLKNTNYCFDSDGIHWSLEDSKFIDLSVSIQSNYDLVDATNMSFSYDSLSIGDGIQVSFSFLIINCNNIYYSQNCHNSSYLFGCVWLRDKKYCILNKQYTKEEFNNLVPKIIEHMKKTWERWEFFPIKISPFGYNETVVNEHFPLSRETALSKWYKRQDKEYSINVPEGIELIKWQDLPDNIHNVDDTILKKAVVCEVSWKPFRIVKPEFDFYRKYNLPLPHKHPDIRYIERLKNRAPRQLHLRTCDNCSKQVISVYPQDSEFKVYCEECYNKEIY